MVCYHIFCEKYLKTRSKPVEELAKDNKSCQASANQIKINQEEDDKHPGTWTQGRTQDRNISKRPGSNKKTEENKQIRFYL